MLESQKSQIRERNRLRAEGMTEEEIRVWQADQGPSFRPAFQNGKRRPPAEGEEPHILPGPLAFRRPG